MTSPILARLARVWLRQAGANVQALLRNRAGGLFAETAVAVAVFVLVGTAVLAGLSTVHRSGASTEAQSVAENIARNQMEQVFSLAYQAPPSAYAPISVPSGYGVSAIAEEYVIGNSNIEKVVITVDRDGHVLLVVETLRARG